MPNKVDSQRVVLTGGLNTSENFLMLSNTNPGFATRLVNYEVALSGGYRRVNGYDWHDSSFKTVTNVTDVGTGPVLGIWGFVNGANFELYAARQETPGTNYNIYLYDTIAGWETVTTGVTQVATGVEVIRTTDFHTQADHFFALVDGINKLLMFDGTTWYQADSTSAGGSGDPGGNQMVDAPALIAHFKDHLFIAGDPTYPSVVAFSAPGDPFTWTAAAGAGQLNPSFEVVAIRPFRDELYIFGETAIKKAIPDLAAGFVLQDVTNDIGCIARDSVIEVNSNIVFFAPDGVRTVAGTEKIGDVENAPISDAIHNTITNVVHTFPLEPLRSVVLRDKTQFRYFINNDVTSRNDAYGLIGGYRHSEQQWEFGEINGFEVACVWSGYDEDGQERAFHGDYDGNVYEQEQGGNFAGSDITSIYASPYIDLGDTTVRKLFRRIDLFTRAEGNYEGTLEIDFDWDDDNVIRPPAYSFSSDGSSVLYDAGVLYDADALYAGSSQPVFKINVQGSAFSIQLGVTVSGDYEPHTLQGFVINYSVKGRE